jgi:hypothetical protein
MPCRFLPALVVVLACGGDAADTAADTAAVPSARVEVDSGAFTGGDERVTWRRAPGTIAQLVFEETARFGDDGVAERRYILNDSLRLLRYTERRTQTVQASRRSPVTQQVSIEVEFDGDQVVQTSTRMVDGEVTVLAPFELEQIQRRALDLLERWRPDPRRTP